MSNKSIELNAALYEYLINQSLRDDEVLSALRQETAGLPLARMQIAPEQGQFMNLLVKLTGARRVIEVGVFTGYSTLCMARALPSDGLIVACDLSEEWTDIARRYWQLAQVEQLIDLRLAPALETLALLQTDSPDYDLAFIDAHKPEYRDYYERCLSLTRTGGLIIVDNVLWGGSVLDSESDDEDTLAIQAFNQFLCSDSRVDISMIPVGDGLTLARKR